MPPRLTFGLERTQVEVRHGAEPEASMRIDGAVVASQACIALAVDEPGQIFVLTGLAVENGDSILDPDQDLFARMHALDVCRDTYGYIQLDRFQRCRALVQREGVELLLDDIDEAQRVCLPLVVRTFTELGVDLEIWLPDMPRLKAFGGHGGFFCEAALAVWLPAMVRRYVDVRSIPADAGGALGPDSTPAARRLGI